jgi:hypothetical protein
LYIVHIDSGVEMRGGQWQVFYLLRGLSSSGIRVRLIAPAGSPLFEAACAQQMDVQALSGLQLFSAVSGADLVHAHDANSHTLAVLTGTKTVISRRVAFPVRRGLASRWKYSRATHYIAVSKYVRDTLIEAGIPLDRITVVYDGVPLDPGPMATDRTKVLAIDSEDPGKCKKIVEQAAALADVPVHFSNNLTRDLPDAAVFVYITELEGLGSAALLAMASGTPVIASRAGGLSEIVQHEETGLLTSNEPKSVAQAIQRLLADPQLASRIAAQARSRVEQDFSIERTVSETVRVYERVLG